MERQVKAAYLYRFAGYVEWPAGALGAAHLPLTIGVLGADALAAELVQATAGRKVEERPVAVRRLQPGDSLGDVAILFVGKPETPRLKALLAMVQPRPMLVVTESDSGLAQGGMVNFLVLERRVRFEVALDAVERNGFRLSSRLLSVAQKVHTGGN